MITPPSTTVPLDPAKFAAAIAELQSKVDSAGNDFCNVAVVVSSSADTGLPTSPEDTKAIYDFYTTLFTKLADNVPSGSATKDGDADAIRAAVTKMNADAEATNYDPTKFPHDRLPAAFRDSAMTAVLGRLTQTIAAKCGEPGKTTNANG